MKKIITFLILILISLKSEAQSSVFRKVDSLLLKGNYQKALHILENQDAESWENFDRTASIYQTIGDHNKAILYYNKALLLKESIELRVKLAQVTNSAGYTSKSISIYEKIIEKDSSNLLVANSLGKLYLAKNLSRKAENIYRYLIKSDSLNPYYNYQLARSLRGKKRMYERGQSYLDAYNLDTLYVKSIYELAKFFKEINKRDSSMLFVDKGLKIDSNSVNFNQLKANALYFSKEFKPALKYLNKLDSLNFKSLNTYEMFGMCHFNLKDYDLAEKYFKMALNIEPREPNIFYRLGTLYYALDNFKLAKLYLTQSIFFNKPEVDKHYLLLGKMSNEEFDFKLALNYFNKAVENNRDNVDALFFLAFASDSYYKDKSIAFELYKKFIQKFGDKSEQLTSYATDRIKAINRQIFIDAEN